MKLKGLKDVIITAIQAALRGTGGALADDFGLHNRFWDSHDYSKYEDRRQYGEAVRQFFREHPERAPQPRPIAMNKKARSGGCVLQ